VETDLYQYIIDCCASAEAYYSIIGPSPWKTIEWISLINGKATLIKVAFAYPE
jgi:hypothetical protein